MRRLIVFVILLTLSLSSFSVVTRDDVASDHYLAANAPEYLIDMPGEGHGVLIKPNWILTVAHLIFSDYTGKDILIHGKKYKIEKVVVHDNAKKPDSKLFKGDAKPLMAFMKGTSDIALLKLADDVTGVSPISLYAGNDEKGKVITAYGRGSTGDGKSGSVFETKRQKVLRKMTNRIDRVDGNWISITLDKPPHALDLEGIDGSGDSGGPLVLKKDGVTYLLGMFSWDYVEGDLAEFKHGLYGGKSYQVRVSKYIDWINQHINND